jgi:hypothetical protein
MLWRPEGVQDSSAGASGQLVLVAAAHELGGGVDEQRGVVALGLLQHDDAGGNRGAEEEVGRQLDDGIDVVVVDQVLADLLLCAAAIEHAGKLDDRRRAVDRQPAQDVQGEGEVGLALGRQHARGREARIVDQQRVGVAIPFDRVRRIGDDGLEGFVVPMRRVGQRVAVGDVELLVVHVVQEHVDPAQVVGGEVDFLTEEALAHLVVAQHLDEVEQQRAGAAGRVVDLVDLGLADHGDARQQFGDLLRRVELAAGLAGGGGVHLHQVFVGVAEQVDGVVGKPPLPRWPKAAGRRWRRAA